MNETTNGTEEPRDAAAERAAFYQWVATELRELVAEAWQQGLTAEQVKVHYEAVIQRTGRHLQRQYGIPTAYLPDILDSETRITLLLTALGDVASARAQQPGTEAAA